MAADRALLADDIASAGNFIVDSKTFHSNSHDDLWKYTLILSREEGRQEKIIAAHA